MAIENNRTVLKHGQKYLKKQNLDSMVDLQYGDGVDYPLEGFNIIVIAVNVWPIKEILAHIAQHSYPNTLVLFRSMSHDILSLFENKDMKGKFEIITLLENPVTQSYMLKRI